jgi:hypothetical protein
MRQHGGEIDDAGARIDGRRLHDGDFVLAERLAHDLQSARQGCVTKGLFRVARLVPTDGRRQGFLGIDQFGPRFGPGDAVRGQDGHVGKIIDANYSTPPG